MIEHLKDNQLSLYGELTKLMKGNPNITNELHSRFKYLEQVINFDESVRIDGRHLDEVFIGHNCCYHRDFGEIDHKRVTLDDEPIINIAIQKRWRFDEHLAEDLEKRTTSNSNGHTTYHYLLSDDIRVEVREFIFQEAMRQLRELDDDPHLMTLAKVIVDNHNSDKPSFCEDIKEADDLLQSKGVYGEAAEGIMMLSMNC